MAVNILFHFIRKKEIGGNTEKTSECRRANITANNAAEGAEGSHNREQFCQHKVSRGTIEVTSLYPSERSFLKSESH